MQRKLQLVDCAKCSNVVLEKCLKNDITPLQENIKPQQSLQRKWKKHHVKKCKPFFFFFFFCWLMKKRHKKHFYSRDWASRLKKNRTDHPGTILHISLHENEPTVRYTTREHNMPEKWGFKIGKTEQRHRGECYSKLVCYCRHKMYAITVKPACQPASQPVNTVSGKPARKNSNEKK